MDRDEAAERPATTRIGPAGGPGRGFRALIALVAVAVAVAVAKPWDWITAPTSAPGREGAAIPAGSPGASPGGAPSTAAPDSPADWMGIDDQLACLSGSGWLAVVDAVDGPTISRSWTRIEPVPAAGPTDEEIARTHVYADAVPRMGFCAPGRPGSTSGGADPTAGGAYDVRVWRITPDGAAAGGPASDARVVVELAPVVISGGAVSDHGALFGPPVDQRPGSADQSRDPESAWAARAPERAPWSPGDRVADAASWPPGTYVFRVDVPGSTPPGADAAWFVIELRGPWTGPDESAAP